MSFWGQPGSLLGALPAQLVEVGTGDWQLHLQPPCFPKVLARADC